MSNPTISRRRFLKGAASLMGAGVVGTTAGCSVFAPVALESQTEQPALETPPLLIGITADAIGQYASSGAMDRRGILMAIKEFNDQGGVLGRPIEWRHYDTETSPETGSRVAERIITREKVSFIIGAVSSGVASAISDVAQKFGVIYLNTNSSSPTESGENRHRVKFVWDGHGGNFAKATVLNAISQFGNRWLLLTNDYVWGHSTSAATRKLAGAYGATIIDEFLVPQGTRDFSTYLLSIRELQPDVVAAAIGGDDLKAMQFQVREQGLHNKLAWITSQQDWPDVYGREPFGLTGTTWYHGLELPGVKDFLQRYQTLYPDSSVKVPGNVFYNGYMATRALLGAVERVGTTNNIAVIKELEQLKISAEDRMQHHAAWIDPENHHLQQTIYLAAAKPADLRQTEYDLFEILASASPEEAMDKPTDGQLEPYEDTPVYEP